MAPMAAWMPAVPCAPSSWDTVLLIGGLCRLSVALQQSGLAALVLLITTVAFAASQSVLSPIGYQTNLMVFAPGRYRFLDVLRYGWPLSLLFAVTVPVLVFRLV